jgi:hypothetical protein
MFLDYCTVLYAMVALHSTLAYVCVCVCVRESVSVFSVGVQHKTPGDSAN